MFTKELNEFAFVGTSIPSKSEVDYLLLLSMNPPQVTIDYDYNKFNSEIEFFIRNATFLLKMRARKLHDYHWYNGFLC